VGTNAIRYRADPELWKDFQFVLYDDQRGVVMAEGHTAPCYWDKRSKASGTGSTR
jgi:hypothetical protein